VSELDDRLLRDINRRNWIILTVLTLLSLFWQSISVTLGVLGGSSLATIGHYWRYRALLSILGGTDAGAGRRFQIGYIVRLGTLALSLYVLIAILKVDPTALICGLSVVVINIFFTTWQRSF
jgi:hypothetical protein